VTKSSFRPCAASHAAWLVLVAGFVGHIAAQVPPPYLISVNVDLVVLHASVRDHKNALAVGLREQDFQVYENGVRQTIRLFRHEDVPVAVGLVVDHSGSMRPKMGDVIAAARTFVRLSNPEDQMFVVNFNERVTLGLPNGIQFTNRFDELHAAILHAPVAGRTALYDAVAEALSRLQASDRDTKVLIVISDGGDNASSHSLGEVLKMAEQSTAMVYTIGIFDEDDSDRNPGVLRRLATVTGGEAFLPAELKDIVAICERIARDIRHRYTIGYVPIAPAQPGAYRKIRVEAQASAHGKLLVRARTGYIVGNPARLRIESAQ
jgi:Ca-activated chloride channel family protein